MMPAGRILRLVWGGGVLALIGVVVIRKMRLSICIVPKKA
jgi:hypothetical protein